MVRCLIPLARKNVASARSLVRWACMSGITLIFLECGGGWGWRPAWQCSPGRAPRCASPSGLERSRVVTVYMARAAQPGHCQVQIVVLVVHLNLLSATVLTRLRLQDATPERSVSLLTCHVRL